MKITRFEISRYEDGHPSNFYKVFIEGEDGKEKLWGSMSCEQVHAVIVFDRTKGGMNVDL